MCTLSQKNQTPRIYDETMVWACVEAKRQHSEHFLSVWHSGNALVSINILTLYTPGPVSSWVGDRLWTGKPPQRGIVVKSTQPEPSLVGRHNECPAK